MFLKRADAGLTQVAEVTVGAPLGSTVPVAPLRLHLENNQRTTDFRTTDFRTTDEETSSSLSVIP